MLNRVVSSAQLAHAARRTRRRRIADRPIRGLSGLSPRATSDLLDSPQFGGVASGIVPLWKSPDFFLNRRHAIAGIRMRGQELRSAASTLRLELFKETRHLDRVVTRARHHLRSQQIGLPFGISGIFHQYGVGAKTDTQVC